MKTRNQRIIEVIQASELPGAVKESIPRKNGGTSEDWGPCLDMHFMMRLDAKDYRVSIPSEPTTRRITKKEWDGQPVVWVRQLGGHDELVCVVGDYSFWMANTTSSRGHSFSDFGGSYSFDRKTWHSFTITEPGTRITLKRLPKNNGRAQLWIQTFHHPNLYILHVDGLVETNQGEDTGWFKSQRSSWNIKISQRDLLRHNNYKFGGYI